MIEMMRQIGIDISKDIHLLSAVEEFVRTKEEKEVDWYFRISPDGKDHYWINSKMGEISTIYPYSAELKAHMDRFHKEQSLIGHRNYTKRTRFYNDFFYDRDQARNVIA